MQVSLGWGHALALTKDGKLFGWGYSADGRLGRIGDTVSPLESRAGMLNLTEGNKSSTLETAENLVLEAMEKEKDMPIIWEPCLIEELRGIEVTDVACGLDHSLILCSKLYCIFCCFCISKLTWMNMYPCKLLYLFR